MVCLLRFTCNKAHWFLLLPGDLRSNFRKKQEILFVSGGKKCIKKFGLYKLGAIKLVDVSERQTAQYCRPSFKLYKGSLRYDTMTLGLLSFLVFYKHNHQNAEFTQFLPSIYGCKVSSHTFRKQNSLISSKIIFRNLDRGQNQEKSGENCALMSFIIYAFRYVLLE